MRGEDPQESWFAIRVRPQRERLTAEALRNKGFEEFLPLYRSKRQWSDRTKEIDFPLFAGYVFCRFNPEFRLPVLTTPGVAHIVGMGKTPAAVDDAEMAALQAITRSGVYVEPWNYLKAGEEVRIISGPLRGLEGIILHRKGGDRFIVSVTLIQRSVAVELDQRWVIGIKRRAGVEREVIGRSHRKGPSRAGGLTRGNRGKAGGGEFHWM